MTGRGAGTLAAIDLDVERYVVDNRSIPTAALTSLHFEHAAPWLLGSYRFDEVLGDVRGVRAGRIRRCSRCARTPDRCSPMRHHAAVLEALFPRRRDERARMGPVRESARSTRTACRSAAGHSPKRRSSCALPLTPKMTVVGFVDAGDVSSASGDRSRDVTPRADVGAGLRYNTPIGVVRVDYGYQLNPIPGLVINGKPGDAALADSLQHRTGVLTCLRRWRRALLVLLDARRDVRRWPSSSCCTRTGCAIDCAVSRCRRRTST